MNYQVIFKKLAQKYKTPKAVQKFIRGLRYNKKDTLHSALTAIQKKEAHCMEGAFVAAAILEQRGYPPLVVSLESQDGLDHVLFVYKEKGRWGAIGQSRDEGLYGRPPIFRSIRSLVWSYFDPYIDGTGRITAYQLANLNETGANWRTSPRSVWKAERFLLEIPHVKLRSSKKRYTKHLKNYKSGKSLPPEHHWW